MKIFVIGVSQTGKSTLSKYLCEKYQMKHIQSSVMVRETFSKKESDFKNKQDFIDAITEYSILLNRRNPNAVSDYIQEHYFLENVIIEGIRNPNNFHKLFDIKKDKVILLDYTKNSIIKTDFESGIDVIDNYLNWNLKMKIITENNYQKLVYDDYSQIIGLLDEKSLLY